MRSGFRPFRYQTGRLSSPLPRQTQQNIVILLRSWRLINLLQIIIPFLSFDLIKTSKNLPQIFLWQISHYSMLGL